MIDWILKHPYEALATLLAGTTSVAVAIRAAIPALNKLADLTATQADNDFLLRLTPVIDKVIAALDILRRALPRVVMGPLPSTQPIASASGRVTVPPMRSISAPPSPTTLKPWPEPMPPAPKLPREQDEPR